MALSSPRIVVVVDDVVAVVVEEEHSVIVDRMHGYPEVATAQHSQDDAGNVAKEVLADESDVELEYEDFDDVSTHVDVHAVAEEVLALAVEHETRGSHGEVDTLLLLFLFQQMELTEHVPSMVAMAVPHHRVALRLLFVLEAAHRVPLVVHAAWC